MNRGNLFDQSSVSDIMANIRIAIEREAESLPVEKLMGDMDTLCGYFVEKHALKVPVLSEQFSAEPPPENPYARSVKLKCYIPFEGDPQLFHVHGRLSPLIYRPCRVEGLNFVAEFEVHVEYPDNFIREKDEFVNQVNSGLTSLKHDIDAWAKEIPGWARQWIEKRRAALGKQSQFLEKLSSIVPLRKRGDGTEKVILPPKRIPTPLPPPRPQAEPAIPDSAYDDILRTIESMVHVIERSPAAFKTMGEEDLRTHLLVGLNGLYEGGATGETFNGDGKTDILIRHNDRNVFIAECLMWKGPDYLLGKMDDQLFKYATWRDSKLAILIFNRNKGFSDVIAKMKATVRNHSQCVRELSYAYQSGARYQFKRADDPSRQFTLTCLAFDVPT